MLENRMVVDPVLDIVRGFAVVVDIVAVGTVVLRLDCTRTGDGVPGCIPHCPLVVVELVVGIVVVGIVVVAEPVVGMLVVVEIVVAEPVVPDLDKDADL